ncbi:LacI family DNA-binding transcriptional regulator [Marasmitruncus massiliensis]|uniref:LacI family DNA-binding transcriptional regulator n=1 Tax=Marasmitruncus massiliensis TaxID=1944642 RepID=UPI000C7D8E55|nr:LacI family DNA-binding transcriptional regulator [Marasmitruncus massiliensis]
MTIKDIADKAGVSKSTVSRVLSGNGYVNEETRKKVESIIEQTHYLPSATARSLSKRETNAIGVIVPEIDNSFFGEILRGITEIVDQNNLTMICCDTNNNAQKEERALSMLGQQRVRGVIITPAIDYSEPNAAKKLRRLLNNLNVPVVVVDREIDNCTWDGVFYENFQSAYCATKVLIEEGHRKIGIITGDLGLKLARERYQGFLQAMEDFDLPVEPRYIYRGDFTIDTAYRLAKNMFESGDIPEAIFTCNNRTNLGFIKAAREKKFKLGRDIAAIGIDHVEVLDILDYNFSYVTRDTVEMGRIAISMLLNRLKNPDMQRNFRIMPYKLVLKGSEKRTPE